jgi:hypothetical protein
MFGCLNRLTSPGAPAAGFGERSPSDHWARPAGAIWWGFTRGVHGDSAWHQAKLRFAMVSIVTGIRTGISTIYNYIDISYHGIINYGDTLNPEWMGMWMVGSLAPESGSCCSTQNVVFFWVPGWTCWGLGPVRIGMKHVTWFDMWWSWTVVATSKKACSFPCWLLWTSYSGLLGHLWLCSKLMKHPSKISNDATAFSIILKCN